MIGKKGVQIKSENLSESAELKNYIDMTKEFFNLIKQVDAIPEVVRRPQHESRSLFRASSKSSIKVQINNILREFFGEPVKPAGKPVPMSLKFNASIKSIGGIKKTQTFYTKKVKSGLYYAAIWPWSKDPLYMTIKMGYCGHALSDKDYNALEQALNNKILKENSGGQKSGKIGGQIQGINLSAFLQMSAMEKSTFTLKVVNGEKIGFVYLKDGDLINALSGKYKGLEAIYKIIVWEDTVIQIEKPVSGMENVINMPLMHILMEGLKKKDDYDMKNGNTVPDLPKESSDDGSWITPDSPDVEPHAEKKVPVKPDRIEVETAKKSEIDINTAIEKISKKEEKKKKRNQLVYGAVACLSIVAVIVVFFINKRMETGRIYKEFASISSNIGDPVNQFDMLTKFAEKYRSREELSGQVNAKIAEVKKVIEDADYQSLLEEIKKSEGKDELPLIISTYREYLKKYPTGVHARDVRTKIQGVQKEIEQRDYQTVLAYAKGNDPERVFVFYETLKKYSNKEFSEDIKKLITDMRDEFFNYSTKRIGRFEKREEWKSILELIDKFSDIYGLEDEKTQILFSKKSFFEKNAENKNIFEILKHNAALHETDYSAAIDVFESYLDKYPETPILEKINQELSLLYQLKKDDHINKELEKIKDKFSGSKNRFTLQKNGFVVKDKKTGLSWCTIDAEAELNQCVTFDMADEYVKKLETGGYKDWRLPTARELQKLYKTKPFYPSGNDQWYWSSTLFKKYTKKLHKIVDVVDTEKSVSIKRIQKDADECGSVRAVRGK